MSVFERRNTPTPRILAVAFDAVRKLERATQTRGARKSVRRRIAD
jgi:hypothetical protein